MISRGSSSLTGNTGLTIEGHASLLIIMNCHHIQPHRGEQPKHHQIHDHQVHIETSEGLWFWSRRTGGGHSRGGGLITISIIIISIIKITAFKAEELVNLLGQHQGEDFKMETVLYVIIIVIIITSSSPSSPSSSSSQPYSSSSSSSSSQSKNQSKC